MLKYLLLTGLLLSPSATFAQQSQPTFVAQGRTTSSLAVENLRPKQCSLFENNKLSDNCSAFRIIRTTAPNNEMSALAIGFFFSHNVTVMYSVMEHTREIVKRNGKTYHSYGVVKRRLQVGEMRQDSDKDEGKCFIAPDNSEAICGLPNFYYVYRR